MSESTALTVRAPQALDPYDPRDFAEARALAKEYADSKLFTAKHQTQTLAIMAAGRELGLSPLAALRMIYVADFGLGAQMAPSADAMKAACLRRADLCEYFHVVERTPTSITMATRRRGQQEDRETFSLEDAKRAKLGEVKDGKDKTATNWAKYPLVMCEHRATSILARRNYPDILGGMYTADELAEAARDVTPAAPAVQPLPAAPKAATPPVVDAVVEEKKPETDDERAERVVNALRVVATEGERAALMAKENLAATMAKGPARDRIIDANKAAKERLAAPAPAPVVPTPSAATNAIVAGAEQPVEPQRTREPGEDDE